MAQNRIAKNLDTVDLFTAPDKPALLWRVQETLNRELNAVEPSEGKSSTALNQKGELNAVEPSEGKSSTASNQKEELNAVEPNRRKSSNGLNEETKRRGARGKQLASGCLHSYTKN